MAESTHHGGCHCGAVHYHAELDLEQTANTCNCSICSRSGTILLFVPAEKFHLEKGADQLTSYHFNKRHIDHNFCRTCGIKSFARGKNREGKEMIAINVRCLDNVDLSTVVTREFDGKSL